MWNARWPHALLTWVVLGQHAWAAGPTVYGSGHETSESRSVAGFTAVSFAGADRVVIEQTGTESLTITAEDNILPYLTVEVRRGRLILGAQPDATIKATKEIVYTVTVKDLREIELTGSGSVDAKRIAADGLKIVAHGSGRMTAAGKVQRQDVVLTGSGSYHGDALETREGTVKVSGSGNAVVNVSDRLDAQVIGSGSVEYIGDPALRRNVTGAGSVRRR